IWKNKLKEKLPLPRIFGMNKALVRLAKPHLRVLLTIAAASVAPLNFTKADTLTAEEQALVDKGAVMEMYKPDEHSRHFIDHIDSVTDPKTKKASKTANNPQAVVCFVFGIEDAEPARKEGRSMAECHYSPSQAHEFLFAQGWNKYHDRFFTRCYVQEGEAAYDKAVEPSKSTSISRQVVNGGSFSRIHRNPESLIRVRQTQSAFHRRAQRNACSHRWRIWLALFA